MKKYILFATLAAMNLSVVSCIKNSGIDELIQAKTIDPKHLATIESLGLMTEGIVEKDDRYIVEGDIAIRKEDMEIYAAEIESQTRQARWKHIVRDAAIDNIRVSTVGLQSGGWEPALIEAINAWNSVPNCKVRFSHVGNWAGDIFVRTSSAAGIAEADYPRPGGFPGFEIRINPNGNSFPRAQKVYILVHELGHIIGLAHTNFKDTGLGQSQQDRSQISGTPEWNQDYNSVMFSHSADRLWGDWTWGWGSVWDPALGWVGSYNTLLSGRFTDGDILAIQSLYGTPAYRADIVGAIVLFPGETKTFNIVYPDILQGFISDFHSPVWTISGAEIVSQTDTSITLRNSNSRLRPVNISFSVIYNNRAITGNRVLNDPLPYHTLEDLTINSTTTFSDDAGIWANNVAVRSGATLTLQARVLVINSPFTVESGGKLMLTNASN